MYSNAIYGHIIADLPPQMVSLTQKNKEWKEKCMDALEEVGRSQYRDNLQLIENYEMVKGRFIYSHYFETEGYTDFIAQLSKEFDLPTYLRHYDIVSQVIKTLSGEYQKRPDIFRIKNHSEDATNEYERTKTDMLFKYVDAQIQAEVTRKLLEQGFDPEKQDFGSEEEAAQYEQLLQQAREALTPPEIQEYMNTTWTQAAEIWGQHQLELDKRRFNLKEKEKKEFEDMLISDRCFRHFYITSDGYNQETWNPVQVFFQKSPDIDYIEDGDYVGRTYYLSIPAIIDRFGFKMTKKEIEKLQDITKKEDKTRWNYSKGSEYVFNEYAVPFEGFQVYDTLRKTIPQFNAETLSDITSGKFFDDKVGLYRITEAYWKTQKKIGKVTYIDPTTGILTKTLVDETFVVPEHFTQIDGSFDDSEDVDTVVWTWVNEVWKGVKINLKRNNKGEDLYLDIGAVDFQFKGNINPYYAKLPVCGQVFSVRNSKSMSLVDLMKPYQIFYNVAMNQLYQIMEREIGRFIVMDVNMFPDAKDWGGEKTMEKFMMVAKELGVVGADTSPQNVKNSLAASAGYLPKEFNMDDSARMISRITLAEKFEQMALRQVGFNEYRLGAFTSEATAGGVASGKESSYAQTESYFTDFTNYLRRCHEMNLNIAQFVQSQNSDISVMNIKSDMSRSYVKMSGIELMLADLHTYVENSQELIRQTEMLRTLALENNTTGADMLDLAEIITENSPAAIKVKLKEGRKRQDMLQQQQIQMEQQQSKQAYETEMIRIAKEDERLDKELQNNLDVAYIREGASIINSDAGGNDGQDKTRQLESQEQNNSRNADLNRQKLELQRQKQTAESQFKSQTLAIKKAEIEKDLQVQREKLRVVQTMKDRPTD